MMQRERLLVGVLCWSVFIVGRTRGMETPTRPMSAEAVLDRYVQVTGGPASYRRYGLFAMYSTVTRDDGTTFNTTVSHLRDGSILTEVDAGGDSRESGVSNGIAWEFSEKKGATILSGKVAARRIAEARGLGVDDWRMRFPTVKAMGAQTVNGKACDHLKLTRTDGSTVERFYDKQSGLLVREISTDFDEGGVEQTVTTDIDEYFTSLGVMHPSLLRVKEGGKTLRIHVDSLNYFPGGKADALEIPRAVVRAVAERRSGGALPNAVDLVEKFVEATGGKSTYQSIKTEAVKAEMTFTGQNLKVPLEVYATAGKMYASLDMPSVGKFEFGTDGTTSWEKSVVLGPRLRPRSPMGGLFGPNADDVMRWTQSDLTMETVGKDEVNGAACYKVRMGREIGGRPANTACFDTQTGLLVKSTETEMQGAALVTVETTFGDYRAHGDYKIAHHTGTKLAGQEAIVDLKEVAINQPLPPGVFDLPADVRALREKKQADFKAADADSEERPTVKKPK